MSYMDVPRKWQRGPGAEPKWLILDESGVILRQIVDRGQGFANERFYVSGDGHEFSMHSSCSEAKAAAEASLDP